MKKKSYCNQCKELKPNRRALNTKQNVGLWSILLFDLQCKKCGTITWQQLEATAPNPFGGKYLMFIVTNKLADINLIEVFNNSFSQ